MNMTGATLPTGSRSHQADCPQDDQLLALVENSLSEGEQKSLIAHLDQCEECRPRLETLAADSENWFAIRENLSRNETDAAEKSARLTQAIRSLQEETLNYSVAPSHRQHASSDEADELPRQLGPYEIIELIGRGGMGIVYKAQDRALNRHVAIKVLTDSVAEHSDTLERFRREARSAAAIRDSRVVAIYAIEDSAPRPYIVMEFVEGMSLEEKLRSSGRLEWRDVARIGTEVAGGLQAAHEAGLIHRDIKPGNILIEEKTERVAISDFGLARSLEESSLTQQGCVRGTPEYIAPEQVVGERIDHRADLFSLGSVLYAACAGEPPFRADTTLAVLRRTQEDSPRPLDEIRDDVPPALLRLIDRLLSKDPGDRFATAGEVAELLKRIEAGEAVQVERPIRTKASKSTPRTLITLAFSLLVLAGIGMVGIYAAGFLQPKGDADGSQVAAKKPKRGRKAKAVPSKAKQSDAPQRVEIVTPEVLMRERIQAEKDQLDPRRHPLLVREYRSHTGPVNSMAVVPGSKLLVSGSGWPTGDRTVRVWDLAKGKQLRRFDTAAMPQNPGSSGPREAPGEFFTVAVTPDGKHAVTGSTGGAVCVWEIATGKLIRQFEGHTATVYGAAIHPNGDQVLTGGRSGIGRLWDLSTGEELMQLPGHRSWIRTVAISPDGKRALTGSYDKVMRMWDLDRAKMIREFPSHDQWVWEIAVAPSGRIAAGVSGTLVQLWDLENGKLMRNLICADAGTGTSVDISPDGRLVISGSHDGKVRLWNVDTGELLETYTGHRDWVQVVRFLPDGRHAVSAGGGRFSATGEREAGVDFALRMWKLPSLKPRIAKPE